MISATTTFLFKVVGGALSGLVSVLVTGSKGELDMTPEQTVGLKALAKPERG